jgi:hypothetical protein
LSAEQNINSDKPNSELKKEGDGVNYVEAITSNYKK